MVRAILDGRKTQTRRVMKPMSEHAKSCPYGVPGDRLWVREAFARMSWLEDPSQVPHREIDGELIVYREQYPGLVLCDGDGFADYNQNGTEKSPWKPSIHMPRRFSRLTLEVKRVWVERVQEISEADAYAEGVEMVSGPKEPEYGVPGLAPTFKHYENPGFNGGRGVGVKHSFQTLWDSINAKTYPWKSNPWVWCVEFEQVEVPA